MKIMKCFINGKEYDNIFEIEIEPICYFDYDSNCSQVDYIFIHLWKDGIKDTIKVSKYSTIDIKNHCLYITNNENE